MKLIVIMLLIGVLQASATSKAQTVTLKARSTSLEDVLNAIRKQTDYNFIYNAAMLERASAVSIDVNKKDLKATLDEIFAAQPLTYVIEDKTVVVTRKNQTTIKAMAVQVRGTVSDAKGGALVGVSVKIKGGNAVTTTDVNGAFSLNLPTGNETLVFTYVGFKTVEVQVKNQTNITVRMEETLSNLEDVVVVGYGTMKKKDLTGAVAQVKGADISLNPVSNPLEALQGRVSGLDVQRGSGQAGQAPTVILRGTRSITGGGTPLYIVDGISMIGGSFANTLNPNDIESIDVLKDASSTAIYGSQGANGVIIITTKKAKAGRAQVDVNSFYGINGFASFPKPLQGDAWIKYRADQWFGRNGTIATDTLTQFGFGDATLKAYRAGAFVDWVDETLQKGAQQNHHIAIRGGSEKATGYLSLGLVGEKGIYKGDQITNYNTRSGVDLKFTNWLKAGVQNTINYRRGASTNSRVNKAYGLLPVGRPYNADGTVNPRPLSEFGDPSTVSPIANYADGVFVNDSRNFNMAINPYLEITPVKNLSIRSNFSVVLGSDRSGTFENENSYNNIAESLNTKKARYQMSQNYSYVWENIVNYSRTFFKDHNFSVTGIAAYQDSRNESSAIAGQNLDYNEYLFYNMGAAGLVTERNNSLTKRTMASVAGRFNYSYKGKYLLQLTNRWDGDSRLIKKWSQFPSASVAWRISEEKFMDKTRSWLDNFKLRAGYGVAGNSLTSSYLGETNVTSTSVATPLPLGGSASLPLYIPTEAVSNPDLTWERSYNTNIGVDISFFKGRLDFSAEAYYTDTRGLLYSQPLPSASGGYNAKTTYKQTRNIGTSVTRGVEFTISGTPVQTKAFNWTSNLTFNRADEQLTSLTLGSGTTASSLVALNLFIGSPIKTLYNFKKIGVWQTNEATEAALYGAKPGDVKLQTVPIVTNGVSDDGVHAYSTVNDRMVLGHENPNWMLGWQNTFAYKGIDLTVFVNARYGQTIDAQVLGYWNTAAQPDTYNYWTPDNATQDFPQPGSVLSNTFIRSLSFVDASYIKIKNVTLGYTLPANIGQKLGLSRLRFYGTAYNPFIFTKSKMLKGVDPESGGTDSFPLFKQLVFGVNISL